MGIPVIEPEGKHTGRMHIALSSNETYSPGLLCGILSILAASSGGGGITFHILDGGLQQATWDALDKKISLFGADISLVRHSFSFDTFEGLPSGWAGLPPGFGHAAMGYARLLLPTLIDEDEVIFVDTDMLFFCDFRRLWEEPLDDNLIAACQDYNIRYLAADSIFDLLPEEAGLWYFSAGLMKVNLKLWRKEDVQGQALRLLKEYGSRCSWADQSALNTCMKGRVKYLDRRWNRFSVEVFSLADFAQGTITIHYISHPKPWVKYDLRNVTYLVWRMFHAQWFPPAGSPAHQWEGGVIGHCCDALARAASSHGIGVRFIDLFCGLLKWVAWIPPARSAAVWLKRQRAKLEIIRFMKDQLRAKPGSADTNHSIPKNLRQSV